MEQQRASVLVAPGSIRNESRAVPDPGPGEVLVRVEAVGVCGSDVHYYRHGRIGDFVVQAPIVLGHEVGGEVVAVGAGVAPERIGQRVSIEPQLGNPWSTEARAGLYHLDPGVEFFATPPIDGAFCEYVSVRSELAFAVPAGLGAEEAALIEPLAVAVAALRRAQLSLGERVAIAGAGPIGLLIAQLARNAGAGAVVVSDPLPGARERALRYGATEVLDPAREAFPERGFEVFVDASGAAPAIRAGVLALGPRGRAVLVGMGPEALELPFAAVQVRELEVRGVFRYANAWPVALSMAPRIDLAGLVTSRFGLEGAGEALERAGAPDEVKVMVLPALDGADR